MLNIIEKMLEKKKIYINNIFYEILSIVEYNTIEEPENCYYKIKLSSNKTLVIIDEENYYYGNSYKKLEYKKIDDNSIEYINNIYNKVSSGSQRIKRIIIGELNDIEKECDFEDYEFENKVISLGVLTNENNLIADVYMEKISKDKLVIA